MNWLIASELSNKKKKICAFYDNKKNNVYSASLVTRCDDRKSQFKVLALTL